MLKIIIKSIYRIVNYPLDIIGKSRRILFNFIIPNISVFIRHGASFSSYPFCDQITFITGCGSVNIGNGCSFGYKLGGFHYKGSIELQPRYHNSRIIIGNRVTTNNNIFICAANLIEIGDDTLIGQNVTIMDHEAHGIQPDKRRNMGIIGEVFIGKNVWIGNNVTILKNSYIGNNSIVAAGAVVAGRFDDNAVIGGVPARIIKTL